MYDFAIPLRTRWRAYSLPLHPGIRVPPPPVRLGDRPHLHPYHKPRQIEFARLGIDHTVMSKRKLRQLVEQSYVSGWDDPRMPTICGLRRRGYTPSAIRSFSEQIGVAKADSTVEYAFLEHCLRSDLDSSATRAMAVLHPVPLTITNYPEGQSETFQVENHPKNPNMAPTPSPSLNICSLRRTTSWRNPSKSTSVCLPTAWNAG